MKEITLPVIFVLMANIALAQGSGVHTLQSVNAYVDAISFNYERAFSQYSIINFELAIAGKFYSGRETGDFWVIKPVFRVEPRYYYNYARRVLKDKNVWHNGANYLAISFDYQPEATVNPNMQTVTTLRVFPKWGMKRAIGRHFTFETAIGPYIYMAQNEQSWHTATAIDLKVGYTLQKRRKINKTLVKKTDR